MWNKFLAQLVALRSNIIWARLMMILAGLMIPALVMAILLSTRVKEIQWVLQRPENLENTNGVVIQSSIEERGTGGRNSFGWHFVIKYEYRVGDKRYVSDRVNFGYTGSSDKTYATGYVEKYFIGKAIQVYYDPDNPSNAVLEPDVKDYESIYLILGSLLGGIFIASLSYFIK